MRLDTLLVAGLLPALVLAAGCGDEAPLTVVAPAVVSTPLHNPGMGFVSYCGETCNGKGGLPVPDLADVLYTSSLTWGDVAPAPGVLNWDHPKIANLFALAQQTGRRVAIRLTSCWWQTTPSPTPAWLTDPQEGGTVPLLHDGAALYSPPDSIDEPEWWNPAYVSAFSSMVSAFGARFDGAPGLAYVDIRVYGWWNEGHRWHATVPWPSDVDKRQYVIDRTDSYLAAFVRTPLVVETASDAPEPPPAPAYPLDTGIDHALAHGTWMRRDGFGAYLSAAEGALIDASWEHSLLVAEPGEHYADVLAGKVWSFDQPPRQVTADEVVEQMLAHHVNYFPLNGPDDFQALATQRPDLVEKATLRTGYRFEVTQASWATSVQPGDALTVTTTWKNSAVGRLPFARDLGVYLLDAQGVLRQRARFSDFDFTQLFEGAAPTLTEEVTVDRGLAPGSYQLAVGLEDPATGTPDVALGIAGDDGMRRFVLGRVEIGGSAAGY